ncbi:MAG: Uma2 family endonuclease [Caldilineaceae bacterium]
MATRQPTITTTARPSATPPKRKARPKRLYAPKPGPKIKFPTNLPYEDGEPLESDWHRTEIGLLVDVIKQHRRERQDFYAGGNMFVYYSSEQIRNRDYRGPDFFIVLDVDGTYERKSWVVWEEEGRYPNVIVELLSPKTAEADKTTKKQLYAHTFRTPNYFYYDPDSGELVGFELTGNEYQELQPNAQGWLWCSELQLWLGTWQGEYQEWPAKWLRFYTPEGIPLPTHAEAEQQRAEAERQRAEVERQRAERAEETLQRWRERLLALGIDPTSLNQEQ